MAYITITNIKIDSPTACLKTPFTISVKFDCLKSFKGELGFSVIYVADPNDPSQDQILDKIEMEAAEYGVNEFDWEVSAPDYEKLANIFDVFDTTVIMVKANIKGEEFFRCSYLIRHDFVKEEFREEPPEDFGWEDLERRIDVKKPMIALSDVNWKERVEEVE